MRTPAKKDTSRAKDLPRAALSAETRRRVSGLWEACKSKYPAAVRRVVDAVAEEGGITFLDVMLIELASGLQLDADAKRAKRDDSMRLYERLLSISLQSRKHLRSLLEAMGPDLSPNEQLVQLPDGLRLVPDPTPEELLGGDLVDG